MAESDSSLMTLSALTASGPGKYVAASVFLLSILFVGVSGIRQALSNYYSHIAVRDSNSELARTAIGWQPGNPNAYAALGTVLQRQGDTASAVLALEEAVDLRTNDFRLWLRLGSARSEAGDVNGARAAFQAAISLAPNYSRPRFEFGTFLLENSELEKGFRSLDEAAERDASLYPAVLEIARKTYPGDAERIGELIVPKSLEGKRLSAIYLIGKGLVTESVRRFLLSESLPIDEKRRFVDLLIENKNFVLAREVWRNAKGLSIEGVHERIYDGGFESTTSSDDNGFGWKFDLEAEEFKVSLDPKNAHSGSRSLKVDFEGGPPAGQWIVSQKVVVEPGTSYRLNCFVRTGELITAGRPLITVVGGTGNELLARSVPFMPGMDKWNEIDVRFDSGEHNMVSVVLLREACDQNPCPIFGRLLLDDFSLEESGSSR